MAQLNQNIYFNSADVCFASDNRGSDNDIENHRIKEFT